MTEESAHLTIGEVLSLVRDEFPDVTISKIRFLESQGLIDPQRTPSGYRKFYDDDVAALRWVLRQQRDNFLPLKVIKAKLAEGVDVSADLAVQQNLWVDGTAADDDGTVDAGSPAEDRSEFTAGEPAKAPASTDAPPEPAQPSVDDPEDDPASEPTSGIEKSETVAAPAPGAGDWLAELQEAPAGAVGRRSRPDVESPLPHSTGLRFGKNEVLEVTGVDPDALHTMIEYGLVVPMKVGGEEVFDASAVAVVRAVVTFMSRGLEPRHLRLYKNGAEREAGLLEQMVLPLLKQRNPKARDEAVEQLNQLRSAGEDLHRALIDQSLRAHFA